MLKCSPRLSSRFSIERKSWSEAASVTWFHQCSQPPCTFILANNNAHFLHGSHLQALNIYTMIVGHAETGKSPAVKTVLAVLRDIDCTNKDTPVNATTSPGLMKTISKQGKAFLASPELFDILSKLLKNDEDNASGDVQLLCKLWSGESASYHFTTEATREIEPNTAFSKLGTTPSAERSPFNT